MITRSDTLKKSDEPQWWQSQDCGMQNHKNIDIYEKCQMMAG